MVIAALFLHPEPSEPPWREFTRRFLLVLSTWLTAHIYALLCDITDAVEAHAEADAAADGGGNNGEAAAAAAAAAAPAAAAAASRAGMPGGRPGRAAKPTLKAGFSLPYTDPSKLIDDVPLHHTWTSIGASNFRVRCGPNYDRNKSKAPSADALGDVVAVDLLRTEKKIFDILSLNHIELPPPTPGWSETYPELLVINQMLPVNFHNSMLTSEKTDGETWNVVTYVRLKPGLSNGWAGDLEPQDASQLAARFIHRAGQDAQIAHCFKEIGVIRNLSDLSVHFPWLLYDLFKKYNGKPILTRPEHFFTRDPAGRYFMIDLDTHRYKYLTRSGLHQGFSYVQHVVMAYGFVVEARKEAEMPETMLCCCELHRIDKSKAALFPPAGI